MLSAVLFTSDIKLESQIEQWMRQALQQGVKLEAYENLDAYKAANSPGAPTPRLEKIAFFVIDLDGFAQSPVKWIAELQEWTHANLRNRIDAVPHVLVMAHEGGIHRVDTLQHESIDDLVLKPLDKSLFLQKCEFMLADDPKAKATFLFTAKALRMIEVGRDVMIDEISEFAVGVRSPGPLPEGAFATIHCDAFGTKAERRLLGRVYESVRHPVRTGEFLARFSYFGITADQLSNVRRFIRNNHAPLKDKTQAIADANAATAQKPTLSKALLEKMSQIKKRQFAVIDMSGLVLEEARDIIESAFKGVSARKFNSSARFLGELANLAQAESSDPSKGNPVAKAGLAFPTGKLVAVMRASTLDIARFEPDLGANDRMLGRGSADWLGQPSALRQAIEADDRSAYDEFLRFVAAGAPTRIAVRVRNAEGQTVFLDLQGSRLEKKESDPDTLLRVEMRETTVEAWVKAVAPAKGAKPEDFRFEAILIDGRFLLPDPQAWFDNLVALMKKAKVLGANDAPPRVFIMGEQSDTSPTSSNFDPNMAPEAFRFKNFADYSFKPLDRRLLILKFLEFWPDLLGLRETENSDYVACELNATMGKDVLMDHLGEYGLAILHPTAFKERSFMRFYSTLFAEGGDWITARCRFCEPAGGNIGGNLSGQQRCNFHFFGETDQHLQRIRLWIRQEYVAAKETIP